MLSAWLKSFILRPQDARGIATAANNAARGGQWGNSLGSAAGSAAMQPFGAWTPLAPVLAGQGGLRGACGISPGLQALMPRGALEPLPWPTLAGAPNWMRGTGNYAVPLYIAPQPSPRRAGSVTPGLSPIAINPTVVGYLYPGA